MLRDVDGHAELTFKSPQLRIELRRKMSSSLRHVSLRGLYEGLR